MLMFLLEEQTQKEVTRIFDHLTELLGIELFQKLFEVILTDNGHEFQDRQSLEYSKNGEVRTRIYYCDPNRSDQKGAFEKNHEYKMCIRDSSRGAFAGSRISLWTIPRFSG